MKRVITKCGHLAYKTSLDEALKWGGYGICDDCNDFALEGYLVPVLNHWMCEKCFKEWNDRAKFYAGDVPFEKRTAAYYEHLLPVEGA